MTRYGYAIRMGGDAEIAGALAAGIERGMDTSSGASRHLSTGLPAPSRCQMSTGHLPGRSTPLKGKAFGDEGKAEESGKASSEAVRRAAMWQHSPEEWAQMMEEARVIYGGRRYSPRWATRLLVGWAMLCYGVVWLYRQQDRLLRRAA